MQAKKSLLKTRSPHTARKSVEFLKKWGFTQSHLHKTIFRNPSFFTIKVDTQLKPKFHFFRTLGFTDQEIKDQISFRPRVLNLNLESNIIPRVSFLENLYGEKPNLIKALKRAPALLTNKSEMEKKSKLDFFKQWGIEAELLLLLLRTKSDILVRYCIEHLRGRMEYARSTMRIVQGSKTFVYAISMLLCNGPQTVEKKIKNLQCIGLLEDELRQLLKIHPLLLTCSTNKIKENIDFLIQTAGFMPNVAFSNSSLLQYSVKKRLMPRHAVFKALSSEQQSVRSLLTVFKLSEQNFLEKIVESNPQASMLKEIYKGRMESADIGSRHS